MKITPVFTPVIILILKIENMGHVRLPTNGVLKYFDFSSLWRLMTIKIMMNYTGFYTGYHSEIKNRKYGSCSTPN